MTAALIGHVTSTPCTNSHVTIQNGVASCFFSFVVTCEFLSCTSLRFRKEMAKAGGYQRKGPDDGEFARMQTRDVKVCLLGVCKKHKDVIICCVKNVHGWN